MDHSAANEDNIIEEDREPSSYDTKVFKKELEKSFNEKGIQCRPIHEQNADVTFDLKMQSEYISALIGSSEDKIQKLSDDYNVKINVPNQEHAEFIKITGAQKDVNNAVAAIVEDMRLHEVEKKNRSCLCF